MIEKVDRYLFRQASTDGDAILQTDYATDYIFRGKTFSSGHVFEDVPTTGLYIIFDAVCDSAVVAIPPAFTSTDGPCVISYYSSSDYTGGTQMIGYNRNTQSSITPSSIIKYGATGTTTGTAFSKALLGTTGVGVASTGGEFTDDDLFVMSNGDKILVFVDNKTGAAIDFVSVSYTWYEF